jgi:Fur family ferric uptake transcriptional regulator
MVNHEHILREAGLRVTQQRASVVTILASSTDHPTVDDVLDKARQLDDTLSLATVYRTMGVLETAGVIRKLTFDDAPARYEMTPQSDRNHSIGTAVMQLECSAWPSTSNSMGVIHPAG